MSKNSKNTIPHKLQETSLPPPGKKLLNSQQLHQLHQLTMQAHLFIDELR